ncbi:MAG: amidohydrolase family protein [Desulforhopalus sp.]|nr:amidohydrolase family protein [Desulforhopalus sp.]
MQILSAQWIVPIAAPIIAEGSLVVGNERILDIGKRKDILARYPGLPERSYDSVIMPGLINAHIHLELAHLNCIAPANKESSFTDWISQVISMRESWMGNRYEIVAAFTSLLCDQYASGVALVADIGNEMYPELYDQPQEDWPEVYRMLEFLAPSHKALLAAEEKIANLADRYPICVHAAYSTASRALLSAKLRSRRLGQVLSIHAAESADELDFLQNGSGKFRDFLEKRKSWDGVFTFDEQGFAGTVVYFDHLGILDDQTLLVHAIHVSEYELKLVTERRAHICLCPGSNRFLAVGKAPVKKMLALGLLPALGTDSPASNKDIDLWREMQVLSFEHPDVPHESILAMATLGGAYALHRDNDYGSLTPGRCAKILHVSSIALQGCRDMRQIMEILVTDGRPSKISWITADS